MVVPGEDELVIPSRYIRGCQGDMEEAEKRWRETLQWREEQNVDQILAEPQPNWALIKECYPHFLHRKDKLGHPIYIERLGYIDLKRLQSNGVTIDEMLRYYVFLTEYIWKFVEPDFEHGALVTILDVDNVGMSDLRGDALTFLKAASKIIQQHYVERSYKMFIVNAPGWFSILWKVIAPLLNENTRRKISILGRGKALEPILEVVDADSLPKIFGGTDELPLGQAPEELALRKYNEDVCAGRVEPIPKGPAHQPSVGHLVKRTSGSFRRNSLTFHPQLPSFINRSASFGTNRERVPPPPTVEEGTTEGGGWSNFVSVVGTRVMAPINFIRQVRPTLFLPAAEEPPQANLGRDNKFHFDPVRQEWVLKDDEQLTIDESEERLIRAIQAAQGFVPEEKQKDVPHIATYQSQPSSTEFKSAEASIRQPSTRLRPFSAESSSHGGRALLVVIVIWRLLSLAVLEYLPLYLKFRTGDIVLSAFHIGLLFSSSAFLLLVVYTLLECWVVNRSALTWSFRVVTCTLAANIIGLFVLGFLADSSKDESLWGLAISLLVVVCSNFALYGGSTKWAIGLVEILDKKEMHVARYEMSSVLYAVDCLGALIGPFAYVLVTDQGFSSWAYPFNEGFWFSLTGVAAVASLVPIFYYGRRPLFRDASYNI